MAKRGRPVGATSVDPTRDSLVVHSVVRAIYDSVFRGSEVSLRDRREAGRLIKRPSPSAYKIAMDMLLREHRIALGVHSIEKIYKAKRAAYYGYSDMRLVAEGTLELMRRSKGLPSSREPFVPTSDRDSEAPKFMPKILRAGFPSEGN